MSASELTISPALVAGSNDRLIDVINKMRETNQWVVPVVKEKKLVGLLSFKDLIRRRVNLETKVINVSSPVISLSPNDDFTTVVVKFYTTKARAIPVVKGNRELVGIITRESLLDYLLKSGQLTLGKAREYMSSPPVILSPEDSVAKARWIMVKDNISRIPVVEKGVVV